MSCKPGSPCYSKTVHYPNNCSGGGCGSPDPKAHEVYYTGPNLPCAGINTCDSLETALQKIDEKICPENLATEVLGAILNDTNLLNQLCTLISNCQGTTTTTTTEPPPNLMRITPVNEVVDSTSYFGVLVERISGVNPDTITFSPQVNRYVGAGCTGGSNGYSGNATLDAGDSSYFAGFITSNSNVSGKVVSLTVTGGNTITTSPQTVTINGTDYVIEGFNQCVDI